MGADFLGLLRTLLRDRLELMDRADRNRVGESIAINGLEDPKLADHVPAHLLAKLREEVEMAPRPAAPLDPQAVAEGTMRRRSGSARRSIPSASRS